MKITDIHNPWRDAWQPAAFRSALFHVESNSKESGRRVVLHQWPKRDFPYPEDMGRQAWHFTVRGYCIQYPFDEDGLRRRDYREPRDELIEALEAEGPGLLQLPTTRPIYVACPQYRWQEENNKGGYVAFDMTFVEWGTVLNLPPDARDALLKASEEAQEAAKRSINPVDLARLQDFYRRQGIPFL